MIFTQQPLRAVQVLFSPMVSRWGGGDAYGLWEAVSQNPYGVET